MGHPDGYYQPIIRVYCMTCKQLYDERDVKFIDISEDFEGKDKLKFKCHECGEIMNSRRFG